MEYEKSRSETIKAKIDSGDLIRKPSNTLKPLTEKNDKE